MAVKEPYCVVIAQNGTGKSTFVHKGIHTWCGSDNTNDRCWYFAQKERKFHDAVNWNPLQHLDDKLLWQRMLFLHDRHNIVFFVNAVHGVPNIPKDRDIAIITYKDARDGGKRWYERDPSYFATLEEAVAKSFKLKDILITAYNQLIANGNRASLYLLDYDQFVQDVMEGSLHAEAR